MFDVPATITNASGTVISTGAADSILGNVTSQIADTGTLAVLAVAAGVPLAFYVIKRLIGLLPSGK